jgi:hypothetical protein
MDFQFHEILEFAQPPIWQCEEGFVDEFSTNRIGRVSTHVHLGSTLGQIDVNFTVSPLSSPKCTPFKI